MSCLLYSGQTPDPGYYFVTSGPPGLVERYQSILEKDADGPPSRGPAVLMIDLLFVKDD